MNPAFCETMGDVDGNLIGRTRDRLDRSYQRGLSVCGKRSDILTELVSELLSFL